MTENQKKPNKIYQEQSFKKTSYVKDIEMKIISKNINDITYQKLVNTSLQSLSKLNPKTPIQKIDELVDSINGIENLNVLKNTIRLINAYLKDYLKPKKDIQEKELNHSKKIDLKRMKNILFDNRFLSPNKFFLLFYAISLFSYTKDKNVIFRVNNLSDKELIDYLLKNCKFFSFNNPFITNLYPYGGGKQKFYKFINENLKFVLLRKKIEKFIDPFMGGMGSFYSSYNHIKNNAIKVVLNDLNTSIFNLNKNVKSKSNHKKMMKHISMIVRTMFIKFNTNEPTFEQYKSFHNKLLQVLNNLEKKGTNKVLESSILLFVLNNGFGGNYKTVKKGSYISASTDMDKYERFFNFVGKIELYHYLYNSVSVKFENKDYKEILKKYTTNSKTYTTFDPPYLSTNTMTIEEFDNKNNELDTLIKNTTSKKELNKLYKQKERLQEGSVYNYGKFGDGFNHEQLLKDLSLVKGSLNYFNYQHPIIEKYSKEYGLNIECLGRKSTNGLTPKGGKIKKKYEVFMTGEINTLKSNFMKGGNQKSVNVVDFDNIQKMVS